MIVRVRRFGVNTMTRGSGYDSVPVKHQRPVQLDSSPVAPQRLRLVLPRKGTLHRQESERVFEALRAGRWTAGGRYAKAEGDDFIYVGRLELAGGARDEGGRDAHPAIHVALKQIVARPGRIGSLRARSPRRRARRQWSGAERLESLGIPTASPLLLATGQIAGRRCDWLLLRAVPGMDLLRHLDQRDLGVADEHDAARRVGRLVARIDSYGWFDRDTKLSNLIRAHDGVIVAIDTVDIQRRPGKRVRMLRAMLVEAIGHDLLPRRTLMMRCLCEAVEEPKAAWRELEHYAKRPVDHTPKTDARRDAVLPSALPQAGQPTGL